jgi:hypothetical protein
LFQTADLWPNSGLDLSRISGIVAFQQKVAFILRLIDADTFKTIVAAVSLTSITFALINRKQQG